MESNLIFVIGLIIVGISVLAAAVTIPVFIFLRSALKKKLNEDYGN